MLSLVTQNLRETLQFIPMLKFGPLNIRSSSETLEKLLNITSSSSFSVTYQEFLMSFVSAHLEIAFSLTYEILSLNTEVICSLQKGRKVSTLPLNDSTFFFFFFFHSFDLKQTKRFI